VTVVDWGGLFTGMFRRGDHDTIANRNGQRGNQLPLDAFNFTIGVLLEGDNEADLFANLTSVASALAGTGGSARSSGASTTAWVGTSRPMPTGRSPVSRRRS
jgi:hypothetical protein